MKVQFLEDVQGSPDGIHVVSYKKGEVRDIPESLFDIFAGQMKGIVKELPRDYGRAPVEVPKEVKGPPENKEAKSSSRKMKEEKEE